VGSSLQAHPLCSNSIHACFTCHCQLSGCSLSTFAYLAHCCFHIFHDLLVKFVRTFDASIVPCLLNDEKVRVLSQIFENNDLRRTITTLKSNHFTK